MAYEPQTMTLEALRAADVPSFIERDPFALKQFYFAEFENETGRKLYPAQTEMFVIEVMAYAKAIMGEAIQTAFLQNRAIWAQGRHLDEIGANVSTLHPPLRWLRFGPAPPHERGKPAPPHSHRAHAK